MSAPADPLPPGPEDAYAAARRILLAEMEEEFRLTASWTKISMASPRVVEAMAKVPRHEFVQPEHLGLAYANGPLPIGQGQTISQPFIVALMSELAQLGPEDRVLEIGTGCGYQAAVLASLCAQVYSIELVAELGEAAAARLARLGYSNVQVRIGDGWQGWPEEAPFDAIVVTAAAPELPLKPLEQLKVGKRMVVPVGQRYGTQMLEVVSRSPGGRIDRAQLLPVAFVPLVRRH